MKYKKISMVGVLALSVGVVHAFSGENSNFLNKIPRIATTAGAKSKLFSSYAQSTLVYINTPGHSCSGVLLDDKHVLTSAHCVYDYNGADSHPVLGAKLANQEISASIIYNTGSSNSYEKISSRIAQIFISKLYNHNSYNKSAWDISTNDLAILRLQSSLAVVSNAFAPQEVVRVNSKPYPFLEEDIVGGSVSLLSYNVVAYDTIDGYSDETPVDKFRENANYACGGLNARVLTEENLKSVIPPAGAIYGDEFQRYVTIGVQRPDMYGLCKTEKGKIITQSPTPNSGNDGAPVYAYDSSKKFTLVGIMNEANRAFLNPRYETEPYVAFTFLNGNSAFSELVEKAGIKFPKK